MARRIPLLLASLLALLGPAPADAHQSRVFGVLTLDLTAHPAPWTFRLDAVDLGTHLHLDANRDGRVEDTELRAGQPAIERYLVDHLRLTTEGQPCAPPTLSEVRPDGPVPFLVDLAGTLECATPYGAIELTVTPLFDYSTGYRHLVELITIERELRRTLSVDDPTMRVRVADPGGGTGLGTGGGQAAAAATDSAPDDTMSGLEELGAFLVEGVRHIFIGWDHIAFILGLTLAATSLRRLVGIVTAFTLAHSVTLALSSLGLIDVPIALAESLIALSVAYVGLENLLREPKRRWILAFGFGLIHGVGFSSVLGELLEGTTLDTGARVRMLLGFNLGVELGQVCIVTLVFPLVALLRRQGRARALVLPASLLILCAGAFWFVQRLGGLA